MRIVAFARGAGQQQRVCAHDASHIQKRTLPATGVKGLLLAQMKSSGKTKLYLTWTKVTGAKASVTLKKGGTFKIKGKVNKLSTKKKLPDKGHGAALRYYTSNKAIATVSSAGKITAKAKGKCTVYVLSISGVRKAVAITVK